MAASSPRQPNNSGKQQRDNRDYGVAFVSVLHVAPCNKNHDQARDNGSYPINKLAPTRFHRTLDLDDLKILYLVSNSIFQTRDYWTSKSLPPIDAVFNLNQHDQKKAMYFARSNQCDVRAAVQE